jgi:hypothetical protein
MKTVFLGSLLFFGTAFTEWKTLDLEKFTIDIPDTWEYEPVQGVDSFIGNIVGPGVKFSFDYSTQGYANPLIDTPEEYAERMSHRYSYVFQKHDVIYTTGDVKALQEEEYRKAKANPAHKIRKVEKSIVPTRRIYKPTEKDHAKHRLADFLVDLTHNDSTVTMVILLPEEIKQHEIKLDTVGNYCIKRITPKVPGHGTTGVYYKSLNSKFTFQIHAVNVPAEAQDDAIKSISSLQIRE